MHRMHSSKSSISEKNIRQKKSLQATTKMPIQLGLNSHGRPFVTKSVCIKKNCILSFFSLLLSPNIESWKSKKCLVHSEQKKSFQRTVTKDVLSRASWMSLCCEIPALPADYLRTPEITTRIDPSHPQIFPERLARPKISVKTG